MLERRGEGETFGFDNWQPQKGEDNELKDQPFHASKVFNLYLQVYAKVKTIKKKGGSLFLYLY